MSEPPAAGEQRQRDTRLSPQPPNQTPQRPWRTEGLPSGHDDGQQPRRFRWIPLAIVLLISYGLVFGQRETLDEPDIYTAAGIPRPTSVPVQA